MSIIPKELLDFNYYKNKLPLYLRASEAFLTHFKIWFDVLSSSNETNSNGIIGTSETLLSLVNIFEEDYLDKLNKLKEDENDNSDFLDKLGTIFGLQRNFSIDYAGDIENLSLNDKDFLLLIRCTIVKNYFDGSREEAQKFYDRCNLKVLMLTSDSAECEIYLANFTDPSYKYSFSEDVAKMFLAGLLDIESMGISYSHSVQDMEDILFWDGTTLWDEEEWVL